MDHELVPKEVNGGERVMQRVMELEGVLKSQHVLVCEVQPSPEKCRVDGHEQLPPKRVQASTSTKRGPMFIFGMGGRETLNSVSSQLRPGIRSAGRYIREGNGNGSDG